LVAVHIARIIVISIGGGNLSGVENGAYFQAKKDFSLRFEMTAFKASTNLAAMVRL
jgi:hypothetical protein